MAMTYAKDLLGAVQADQMTCFSAARMASYEFEKVLADAAPLYHQTAKTLDRHVAYDLSNPLPVKVVNQVPTGETLLSNVRNLIIQQKDNPFQHVVTAQDFDEISLTQYAINLLYFDMEIVMSMQFAFHCVDKGNLPAAMDVIMLAQRVAQKYYDLRAIRGPLFFEFDLNNPIATPNILLGNQSYSDYSKHLVEYANALV